MRDGFGKQPCFECLIAESEDGVASGFALYFYNYSTWRGRSGIHLEDLFVLPRFRGLGIGKALLSRVAARAAELGASLDEVREAVADARERLDIWFCLDTLEYLRRGGRIGAAQAMLGGALKLKPILTFGTEIAPVGRVRTHRRGVERMVAYLVELKERGATDWIVQHAQAHDDA